jgi:hypothetical protein
MVHVSWQWRALRIWLIRRFGEESKAAGPNSISETQPSWLAALRCTPPRPRRPSTSIFRLGNRGVECDLAEKEFIASKREKWLPPSLIGILGVEPNVHACGSLPTCRAYREVSSIAYRYRVSRLAHCSRTASGGSARAHAWRGCGVGWRDGGRGDAPRSSMHRAQALQRLPIASRALTGCL